jgi:hypothetical protein
MIYQRPNAGTWGVIALCGVALMAGIWLLRDGGLTMKSEASRFARRQREWRGLATLNPAPTEQQAAIITAELARAGATLDALEERLWDRNATAALLTSSTTPTSRTEAFFDLTTYVGRMHEQAARYGVAVTPGEQFGFSAYAREGPEPDLIPSIHRQRVVGGFILENLFAGKPRRLEKVERTAPQGPVRGGISAAPVSRADSPVEADTFVIDPRSSLQQRDVVETTAFRLTFVGSTATLRSLLNGIVRGGIPLVARRVDVEPVKDTSLRSSTVAESKSPLVPVVRPSLSRMTVTLEFCDIGRFPVAAAGSRPVGLDLAGARAVPCLWVEPPVQSRGRGWTYDVFTPPSIFHDQRIGLTWAVPATSPALTLPADGPFDLVLLGIRRSPFRMQLVGYAGKSGDLRGILAHVDTGDTVVVQAGQRLVAQGLFIKRLELTRPGTGGDEHAATSGITATAVVEDETTGEEVMLSTREPCLMGVPRAVFTTRRTPGFRRELAEGESIVLEGTSYCVGHIDLQPPQATVACVVRGGSEPLVLTLTPPPLPIAAEVTSVGPTSDGNPRPPPDKS